MGWLDSKSPEERANEAGQKDGSEGESKNWWYSHAWENKDVADAYEAGYDNGRENMPKDKDHR